MAHVWIGTSGWTYDGWRGPFYPKDVPKKRSLNWYSEQFTTTEINGSFYRTPSLEAVRAWRNDTPKDFVFAWKASKFITHWKRLSENCKNSIELMETRLKVLGPTAGPGVVLLPARVKAERGRVGSFFKMVPKRYKNAFEVFGGSWYEDKIFDVLGNRNVSLCLSDHVDAPSPWEVTAKHVYIRGHGPTGQYKDQYSQKTLRDWATTIRKWKRRGLDVYCYFDNDQK